MVAVVVLQYLLARSAAVTVTTTSSSSFTTSEDNHHQHQQQHQHRESQRRIQHALTGTVLVLFSYIIPTSVGMWLLTFGAIGIVYLKTFQTAWYQQVFGPLLRPSELVHEQLPGAFYFLVGIAATMWLVPLPYARYATLCLSWADPMAALMGQWCTDENHHHPNTESSQNNDNHNHNTKGNNNNGEPTRRRRRAERPRHKKKILQRVLAHRLHSHATVAGCIACFTTAFLIGYTMGDWLLELPPLSSSSTITSMMYGQQPFLEMMMRFASSAMACTLAEACPFGNDNLLIPIATALALYLYDNSF